MTHSACYNMILNMWIMGTVTEAQIIILVTKGRLKQWEADMILATPQNPNWGNNVVDTVEE